MSTYQIAVIVGSLRKESFTRQLADAIVKLAPDEISFKHSEIGDLPLYNQDDDANPADTVKRFKSDIVAVQGLLIVTTDYNSSSAGMRKTDIDQASRRYRASDGKD